MKHALLTLFALLFLPISAQAFDILRCDHDGQWTPSWSAGRDQVTGCLLVDVDGPGGNGAIPISNEALSQTYGADGINDPAAADFVPNNNEPGGNDCNDEGSDCTMLAYNYIWDGYRKMTHTGDDVLEIGRLGYKYLVFKNSGIGNTWRCGQNTTPQVQPGAWNAGNGLTWTGNASGTTGSPAGSVQQTACYPSGDPRSKVASGHTDLFGTQSLACFAGDWMIFQDSKFVNTESQHATTTQGTCPTGGGEPGSGNVLMQNFYVGFDPTWGDADIGDGTTYEQDCIDRQGKHGVPGATCNIGNTPRLQFDFGSGSTSRKWAVNSVTDPRINPWIQNIDTSPFIIVNNGCNNTTMDCVKHRTLTYNNGWPSPLGSKGNLGTGPSSCPNGLIAPASGTPAPHTELAVNNVYCYTSIEAALTDSHTATSNIGDCPDCPWAEPPWIRLSDAGWETPPSGGGGIAVTATLTATPNPTEKAEDFTLAAVASGGNGTFTSAAFDCDGDGSYDDGTDTTIPFSVVCTGFTTIGNKTVAVRITDSAATTGTQSVPMIVNPCCGDGDLDGAEVCDIGPPENLGNTSFDTCEEHGLTGGGALLDCRFDCMDWDTSQCTVPVSCGNGVCAGGETVESCFEDCATVSPVVSTGEIPEGWDESTTDLGIDPDINRGIYSDASWSVRAYTSPEVLSVLFIVNNDRDDPRSRFINSELVGFFPYLNLLKLFALCGYSSSSYLPNMCSLTDGWLNGDYQIDVIPCSSAWTVTNQDTGCTDNGGEVGIAREIDFTVKHIQSTMLEGGGL